MSKAVVNQRYIYKIHSSRFRVNNWDLKLTIEEAKDNEELVSIGDSIALRMIRKIRNNNVTEDYINKLKSKRNKIRQMKTSTSTRDSIKELNNKINEATFIKDYITIVFDNVADWKRANSKKKSVKLNGIEFVRLIGTNGGIKKNTVVFCAKEIHDELDQKLNNGRDESKQFVPAKFEAYKSLAFSASTPVTQPKKILVIKDGETNFNADVIRVYDDKEGGFKVKNVENYPITRAYTDGCSSISIELAKQWTIDMGIKTEDDFKNTPKEEWYKIISSGFNVRNAWCKGMLFVFDYKAFASEVVHEYMVEDAWGDMKDIREVDLILTTNMLKLWDSYESVEHYMQCCKENDFAFCVAKALPLKLENTRNMNYQFLQSYNLSDDDINELIKPTLDTVNGLMIGDYAKTLLFLKGNKITEKDFREEQLPYIKALMIDKKLINDPFIRHNVDKMISKRINDAKKGVLQVNGCYSIVAGDLYAQCEHMFKMEVKGLLKKDEFYANTWSEKGINKIVSFRAPQTNHNNIKLMNLKYTNEVKKWFKYMRTCTVINAWDTTMDAMNGMDEDGDALIETDNAVLLRRTEILNAIICEQKSAEKSVITRNSLIKANQNGFNNDVGGITNKCTAMFDVLARFKEGTNEYKEVKDRIVCFQAYQQEIIDSCKGIIPKEVPKEWYDWKEVKFNIDKDGSVLESEEEIQRKLKLQQIGSFKKPYFFIYNYSNIKHKYEKYIKNSNTNCLIKYGMSMNELLNLENPTDEQEEYIKYYKRMIPVSMEQSTMNRICWRLEESINSPNINDINEEFDKEILKTDMNYNNKTFKLISGLYEEFKKTVSDYMATVNAKTDKDEIKERRECFINNFKEKALEKCTNEEELCNIAVDLCYDNSYSKLFVWTVSGEQIIKNLLKKNNNYIKYPILDKAGDIEWLGSKYKLIEKQIHIEEVKKC